MKRLLEKSSDITAVFGLCDTVAIGAMRAISDVGMKVPDDISIVGFDGIKFWKIMILESFLKNWQKLICQQILWSMSHQLKCCSSGIEDLYISDISMLAT